MAAPDPHSSNNVINAVLGALTLIGGSILGAFAKQFTFGDGKEIRQELREEVKRLREERAHDQEELTELRDDVRALRDALEDAQLEHAKQIRELRAQIERLTITNQRLLIGRTEARALLNACERRDGTPETPWPPDPTEGGTV